MTPASAVASASSRRTARLAIASLWRRNRRQASVRCDRPCSSSPSDSKVGGAWVLVATGLRTCPGGWSMVPSGIADPWVEDGVEDVRHQVEHDHERHRDHYP